MPLDPIPTAPNSPYRRWIEGSGLSLEANTPSTPTAGTFYVLQEGVVCFSSDDLAEARVVFDRLRGDHWEALLASPNSLQRLDGARGLIRTDRWHVGALAVLAAEGSDGDRTRVARAQQRARYEARRAR